MTEQPATRPADTQRERRGHDFYPDAEQAATIPPLYGTEDLPVGEKVLHLHYFAAACDWWIAEYDPATGDAFGYACLGDPQNAEWGHVNLPELEQVNVHHGVLIVERACTGPRSAPPTPTFPAATPAEPAPTPDPRVRRRQARPRAPRPCAARRTTMSDQQHGPTDPQPTAELAMLDPATLLTDHNIRQVRADDPFRQLVASIREHGVLVPIVATRDHQGIRVRYGHRRALAAVHAGRDTVPVVVYTGTLTDATAAEIDRILGQHAENTHREGLTVGETVAAFGQLAALGVTPARIARRSKTPRRTVDAALAAAASEVATKATERWDFLTLDDAAALAEFDDDPDAVKALVTAAKSGENTAHVAQRLRDQRDTTRAIATLTTQLKDSGVAVIGEPPYDEKVIRALRHLTHDGQPLTTESHAACPGHAAYVKRAWGEEKAETVYVCVHPRLHGHTDLTSRTPSSGGAMSDEQKAERRTVVANNEAWRSAEKVRRTWLTDFLTRRTPPKGTAAFLATVLLDQDCHPLSRACGNGHHRAHDLFRLGHLTDETDAPETRRGRRTPADLLDNATEARALVVTLGLVLAAHEDTWTTDTWRRPSTADTRYLMFLAANGYTPSGVEQLVLGAPIAAPTNESDDDEVEVSDHDE